MRLSGLFTGALAGALLLGASACAPSDPGTQKEPFPNDKPGLSAPPLSSASPEASATASATPGAEATATPAAEATATPAAEATATTEAEASPALETGASGETGASTETATAPKEDKILPEYTAEITLTDKGVEGPTGKLPMAKKLIFKVVNNSKSVCSLVYEGPGLSVKDIAAGSTKNLVIDKPCAGPMALTVPELSDSGKNQVKLEIDNPFAEEAAASEAVAKEAPAKDTTAKKDATAKKADKAKK